MESASDYLTPAELVQRYPNVRGIGWSATKIGIFYKAGLLVGYYSSSERKVLIQAQSFIQLVHYANSLAMEKIVKVD